MRETKNSHFSSGNPHENPNTFFWGGEEIVNAHIMQWQGRSDALGDEFYCPVCGRHIFRNFATGQKTALCEGDIAAPHAGSVPLPGAELDLSADLAVEVDE